MAARYLRSLASLEKLSALGFEDEMHRLLAGIDPLDAQDLAAELDADNAQVIPIGNPTVLDVWRETYPRIVHADDDWSRKVGA